MYLKDDNKHIVVVNGPIFISMFLVLCATAGGQVHFSTEFQGQCDQVVQAMVGRGIPSITVMVAQVLLSW